MGLLPKPDACHGCPLYGQGVGFVPDEYVEGAPVLVMGQNPGEDEESGRRVARVEWLGNRRHATYEPHPHAPYLGITGYDMERKFFPFAALERGRNVSLANPIRCRWQGGNALPPLKDERLRKAVEHCQREHFKPPQSTRLIVAEGAYALYACTGEDGAGSPGHKLSMGIEGWRGYALPYNPPPRPHLVHADVWRPRGSDLVVFPTFHLAYLYRAPWHTPVSQRDWSKVQHVLTGRWPEPVPDIRPDPPIHWPAKAAFDTEFIAETGELIRYSMAHRDRQGTASVWCVEEGAHAPPLEVPHEITVVFHHMEADVRSLSRLIGDHRTVLHPEDTMYKHAVLWPDLDHDLDFVGSLYARTNRWKHLFRSNPRVYAALDALGTWDADTPLSAELDRDPQVKNVYYSYQLPLATIIHKARGAGLRVIPERVKQALARMDAIQAEAELKAQAATGWPLNIGSSAQVAAQLYSVEAVHLNPISGKLRR